MPSGGSFEVQTTALQGHAQQVADVVQQLRTQLNTLNNAMTTLFSSNWQGLAAASWQRVHATWNGDYTQLNQQLDAIQRNLVTSNQQYITADTQSQAGPGA
jgi:WXG100 family type VII secretion target